MMTTRGRPGWRRPAADLAIPLDLDDDGAALAATGAHRRDADATAAAGQLVGQRGHHARTGGRDGVAKAAAAAGEVHLLLVDAVFAARRDRHGSERLVDLPQRDVAGRQT